LNRIEEYYNYRYDEWGRLLRHRIEYEMTKRALDKYISPNSSVLDVGGGPGRYSIYLAQKGHEVTLVDFSEKLVEQAAENSKNAGVTLKDCIHGNALYLDKILPDRQFDVVLCMGPMYHLLEESERRQAIEQCMIKLKAGGILIVSFISAYAPLLDCLGHFPEAVLKDKDNLLGYLNDGRHVAEPDDAFTDAYFFNPMEIDKFMADFKLDKIRIFATDCYAPLVEGKLMELPGEIFQSWIDVFEQISANTEILGCCEHILYIARKV